MKTTHPIAPRSAALCLPLAVLFCICACRRAADPIQPAGPTVTNSIGMEFIWVPPGEFVMGKDDGEPDEGPAHKVRITRGFYLGKYEVTQAQWERVMGSNPSRFIDPNRPVEQVSWDDTQPFIAKLNAAGDGYRYRLPTEAEWEYASRAGRPGPDPEPIDEVGWYDRNSGGETHRVGQKKPNAWGFHDMRGNVLEWCQDWYGPDYYAQSPPADPQGPDNGINRTRRGCSWIDYSDGCRTTYRYDNLHKVGRSDAGLRLVAEKAN